MKLIFENTLEVELRKIYETIFKHLKLWNSNGINEVNLTVNLINSLKISLQNNESVSGFEIPLPGNKRLDGLVYSSKENSIFFIESKKFKRNQPKYKESLVKDITRILSDETRKSIFNQLFSNSKEIAQKELNQYFVFIADHWKKDNSDEEVQLWFEKYAGVYESNGEKFQNIYSNSIIFTLPNCDEQYMIFIMVFKK